MNGSVDNPSEEVCFQEGESQDMPQKRSGLMAVWVRLFVWFSVILLLVVVGMILAKRQQGPLRLGSPAPDFTLTTFEGDEISLNSLRGKVVLVNFWASWCKPCEQEAADLEKAWKLYQDRDDVIFLGIAWTDTDKNAKAYLEKFAITYPNGPDMRTQISQRYRITGVPETFVIDKDGNLSFYKFSPFLSVQEIQNVVEPLREISGVRE
jgi:cytochrome c biogenesis protein CcmG, thiol:disulfide interchange protein DsbE